MISFISCTPSLQQNPSTWWELHGAQASTLAMTWKTWRAVGLLLTVLGERTQLEAQDCSQVRTPKNSHVQWWQLYAIVLILMYSHGLTSCDDCKKIISSVTIMSDNTFACFHSPEQQDPFPKLASVLVRGHTSPAAHPKVGLNNDWSWMTRCWLEWSGFIPNSSLQNPGQSVVSQLILICAFILSMISDESSLSTTALCNWPTTKKCL